MIPHIERTNAACRVAAWLRRGFVVGVVLALVTACDVGDLLSVETPSRIPVADVETPANAALLVRSAVGDFECAYAAYVVAGGLVGEEFADGRQMANRHPYDRRTMQPIDERYSTFDCTEIGVYTPVQTSRASAERILWLLKQWTDEQVPNRAMLITVAAAHAGYSLVLLGEGFCSMAISSLDENRKPVHGGEITRDSVFRLAEARFAEAIPSSDASIRNMAYLGRAKARQNLGRLPEAKADAQQLPAAFVRDVTASAISARRQNRVWSESRATLWGSLVAEPYKSMTDPRVSFVTTTQKTVVGIEVVYQTKYTSASSPIPFATGDEAQLIIAEADIIANPNNALTIINAFRGRGNQPALSTTDPVVLKDALIDQRRRELFLEGQHLGDLIRYSITPMPPAGTPYHGSGTYGNQLCMPLPAAERLNNPAIPG